MIKSEKKKCLVSRIKIALKPQFSEVFIKHCIFQQKDVIYKIRKSFSFGLIKTLLSKLLSMIIVEFVRTQVHNQLVLLYHVRTLQLLRASFVNVCTNMVEC